MLWVDKHRPTSLDKLDFHSGSGRPARVTGTLSHPQARPSPCHCATLPPLVEKLVQVARLPLPVEQYQATHYAFDARSGLFYEQTRGFYYDRDIASGLYLDTTTWTYLRRDDSAVDRFTPWTPPLPPPHPPPQQPPPALPAQAAALTATAPPRQPLLLLPLLLQVWLSRL